MAQDLVRDPWAVAPAEAVPSTAPWRAIGLAVAVWAVGLFGPVAAVWGNGPSNREGAAVLAGVALAWVLLLVVGPWRWWRRIVLLATVPLGVAVVPAIGGTPVVVAAAGILVAHAALIRWDPLPGWRSAADPMARLALPVLAAAELSWARSQRLPLSALLFGAALVVVELHHRFPGVTRRGDRAVERVLHVVVVAVGSVITFVVALPLLYLPGLVGRAWHRLRRPPSSTWKVVGTSVSEHRRDADRPFAGPPPGSSAWRHLAALAVVALVVAGAVVVVDRPSGDQPPDDAEALFAQDTSVPWSDLPALEGVDYADELMAEHLAFGGDALRSSTVGDYVVADVAERYTNVTDGVRRSRAVPDCDCRPLVVWLLGGSAAFGIGQRDEHTIASELIRIAGEDGRSLDVRNMAVPGWTLWQEYQGLLARLALGTERPDLVVFYDGANDVAGAVFGAAAGQVDPTAPIVLQADDLKTLVESGSATVPDAATLRRIGEDAADRYRALQELVEPQLAAMGIDTAWFFQPDALTDPVQRRGLDALYQPGTANRARTFSLDAAAEAASLRLAPDVHDLRHLFDGYDQPVFLDTVHTNEVGATVAAGAIYEVLGPQLDELER